MRSCGAFAAEDAEAPNAGTLRRIDGLQRSGRPVDPAAFPRTDHGILGFERSDGGRVMLRYPPGHFPLLADWIARTEPAAPARYGEAALAPRRRADAADLMPQAARTTRSGSFHSRSSSASRALAACRCASLTCP